MHRVVELPAGGGVFIVGGLPLSADPEQVRVRCTGGDVTGVISVRDIVRAWTPAH